MQRRSITKLSAMLSHILSVSLLIVRVVWIVLLTLAQLILTSTSNGRKQCQEVSTRLLRVKPAAPMLRMLPLSALLFAHLLLILSLRCRQIVCFSHVLLLLRSVCSRMHGGMSAEVRLRERLVHELLRRHVLVGKGEGLRERLVQQRVGVGVVQVRLGIGLEGGVLTLRVRVRVRVCVRVCALVRVLFIIPQRRVDTLVVSAHVRRVRVVCVGVCVVRRVVVGGRSLQVEVRIVVQGRVRLRPVMRRVQQLLLLLASLLVSIVLLLLFQLLLSALLSH